MLAQNLGFSADTAYRFGWTVIQSLWEATALGLASALIAACLPRSAVNGRYLILLGGLSAMIVACAITFAIAPDRSPAWPASPRVANDSYEPIEPTADQHFFAMPLRDIPSPAHSEKAVPTSTSISSRVFSFITVLRSGLGRIASAAGQGWIVGVLLLAFWRSGAWIAAQRFRRLQTESGDAKLCESLRRLAEKIGCTAPVRLLTSRFVETPIVIGCLRPVILMPAALLTGLTLPQLEAILAHELAHILRRDYLINSLQLVAETLLFYHPAAWWMSRQIRLLREEACDQIAVRACGDSCAYAETLVALEEMRFATLPELAAAGQNKSELAVRVRHLLGLDEARNGMAPLTAAMILLGMLLIGINCKIFAVGPASRASSRPAELPTAQTIAAQLLEFPTLVKTFRASAMETDKLEYTDSGKVIPTPQDASWAKEQAAFSGEDLFSRTTLSIPNHDTITVRRNGVISSYFPQSGDGQINRSEVESSLVADVDMLCPWRDTQGFGYSVDPASMKTIKVLGWVTYHQMNCIRFERAFQGILHTTLATQMAGHLVPVYDERTAGHLTLIEETPSLDVINGIPVPKELMHTMSGPWSVMTKLSGGAQPPDIKPDANVAYVQHWQFDSITVNQPLPADQFDPGWVPGTMVHDYKTGKDFIWKEKENRAPTSQPPVLH